MGAEDARRAVDAGADGIVISNHGGRQLEGAPATIDVLPEIVAEVGGETTILLDSGVRRANDVARAVALGADAVLIGRMSVYGLALGGEAGVTRMLRLLHQELVRTLRLLGVASIHDLDPSFIDGTLPGRRHPTRAPAEVSARRSGRPRSDLRVMGTVQPTGRFAAVREGSVMLAINTASSLISLVIGIVFAVVCSRIAVGKGRGPILWAILGFFFSLISLIIILVLPRKNASL